MSMGWYEDLQYYKIVVTTINSDLVVDAFAYLSFHANCLKFAVVSVHTGFNICSVSLS